MTSLGNYTIFHIQHSTYIKCNSWPRFLYHIAKTGWLMATPNSLQVHGNGIVILYTMSLIMASLPFRSHLHNWCSHLHLRVLPRVSPLPPLSFSHLKKEHILILHGWHYNEFFFLSDKVFHKKTEKWTQEIKKIKKKIIIIIIKIYLHNP